MAVLIIKQVEVSQPVIVLSMLPIATSWLERKPILARKQHTMTTAPARLSYLLEISAGYVISCSLSPRRFVSLEKVMPKMNVPMPSMPTYQTPETP